MTFEIATFALGCFWEPDVYFSKLKGVISTRVGYSGGKKVNPTYRDLGNHTESVEIKFDVSIITFKELLGHFWKLHDATIIQKTQYKSIIFYHSIKQKKDAIVSKKEQRNNNEILTEIIPAGVFYQAEEYHQKYLLK